MFEKVNPMHPDKIADRIAGAMLDLAYKKQANPKCAVEVLIGHGYCHIINETSCHLQEKINNLFIGFSSKVKVIIRVKQDVYWQITKVRIRSGDNESSRSPDHNEQEEISYNFQKNHVCFF